MSRVQIAYAKSAAGTVFAAVDYNNGAIYKSVDGGATWAALSSSPANYLNNQGWYDNTIWVDPTNANKIVVGGLDLWQWTYSGGIWTWTQISDWVQQMYGTYAGHQNCPHADHHAFVSDPGYDGSTNTTVYSGNDGGFYTASSLGSVSVVPNTSCSGWAIGNTGLTITQFYGVSGSTAANNRIIAGSQDNASLYWDGALVLDGKTWSMF